MNQIPSPIYPRRHKLLVDQLSNSCNRKASLKIGLLAIVEAIFRKQREPMVLILEDMHWSGASQSILKRLNAAVRDLPLLIAATYRNDEYPQLQQEFGDMRQIKLGRLDESAIAELSASISGRDGTTDTHH